MTIGPPSVTPALGTGFHPHLTDEQYFGDPVSIPSLSNSLAKVLIKQSCLHGFYRHPRLGAPQAPADDTSRAMDFGSIGHKLLLEKGAEIEVGPWPTWAKEESKVFRDAVRARGNIPCLKHVKERADAMTVGIRKELVRLGYAEQFARAQKELPIIWEEDGVWFRSKLDAFDYEREAKRGTIFDLKITEQPNPADIERSFGSNNYDLQACFYETGVARIIPEIEGRIEFVYFFCESDFPFSVIPVVVSGEFKELGRMKFTRAAALWKRCMETGFWPPYCDKRVMVFPKPWDMKNEAEAPMPSFEGMNLTPGDVSKAVTGYLASRVAATSGIVAKQIISATDIQPPFD